jgi:pyruvate dehydrogenase kinase 2/3/4
MKLLRRLNTPWPHRGLWGATSAYSHRRCSFAPLSDDVSYNDTNDNENSETEPKTSIATSSIGIRSRFKPIPPETAAIVEKYSCQQPTAVSLQMLMKTGQGNGDFWGRTYHSASNKQFRTTSCSPNLLMMTSPWRRLGLGPKYATDRLRIQMADYLRKELPIRLSHRIKDLDHVPHLRHMEAVQAVKNIYIDSFMQITSKMPSSIKTATEEQDFADLLLSLYENHGSVLVQMAQGAYQLRTEIRRRQKEQRRINQHTNRKRNHQPLMSIHATERQQPQPNELDCTFARMDDCHQFLDRFYMSRIGIRFLAAQYLTFRNPDNSQQHLPHPLDQDQQQKNQYIGMICQETSPSQCVRQATIDASAMCRRLYGRSPRVDVTGRLDLTFPYIPTYLHYILLELLKNSLRATMETHMHSATLPHVQVVIADGTENEDVVIKIADEGGGIPRSQMDQIWSYLFTTADPKIQDVHVGGVVNDANKTKDHSQEAPLAGLGFGLPISRSYCRYFGGDLDLISMEGYGTDAFVHLKRLGDTMEPVPI